MPFPNGILEAWNRLDNSVWASRVRRCWNFWLYRDPTVSSPLPLSCHRAVSRFALSLTFIRPFICMNSNYAERLSAVSAQTRILLPLEDEINAGPINSTLPSSLPPLSPFLFLLFPQYSLRHSSHPSSPDDTTWLYDNSGPRLCLTFESDGKMRFPIANVVGFMLRLQWFRARVRLANNYERSLR